jgi:PAS domain S-box-containing protein
VLRTISRSSVALEAVLNTLVETVARLCRADQAYMFRHQEGLHHLVASCGVSDETKEYMLANPFTPDRGQTSGRVLMERRTIHIPDVLTDQEYTYREGQKIAGFRTMLGIPLMREDVILGVFVVSRTHMEPFSDREIALATGFADQAVIAIENARLFEELRDRQAELRTTFDNIGDGVVMFDDQFRLAAWNRNFQALLDVSDDFLAKRPSYDDYVRMLIERGEFGSVDHQAETRRLLRDVGRQWSRERTRPDGRVIEVRNNPVPGGGTVAIYSDITKRKRAEAEIAAARDAAEAALERQTATADILKVIASSPSDVQPVFDAIAERSNALIGGRSTAVYRLADDKLHLMSLTSISAEADAALKALFPRPLSGAAGFEEAVRTREVYRVTDAERELAGNPNHLAMARLRGWQSYVLVPLIQDGEPIGVISVTRADPGLIADEHVDLLKTFADQAVIAIRNARLFNELREALEQQTATSQILQVISQSPTDVKPVLDAVGDAALRFCGASDVQVCLREADKWYVAVHLGPLGSNVGQRRPITRQTGPGRAISDGRTFHAADVQALDAVEFAEARLLGRTLGFNSAIVAPMMRDDVAVGALSLRRPSTGPFTVRQIELLESFAAQAVIAIENVRLFTELRDSLERLKAAQANLIQAEKMASLGQLTAGIAHEIKNPLNFVNNFAGLSGELVDELKQGIAAVLAAPDEDKRAELQETMDLLTGNLAKIVEHGRRADGIVKSMLAHSRGGTGDWQTSNINSLVEEALNLAYHGARAQDQSFNVTLERDFGGTLKPIDVVPQDVTRVFLNLFGNGFYAANKRRTGGAEAGYRPTLTVSTRDLGEAVEVKVRDNGIGMTAEVREKLFQPFFTTKPTGEGTGLGLSISYDIVTQQHSGTIEVESEMGQFTEFIVRLPRIPRVASAKRA